MPLLRSGTAQRFAVEVRLPTNATLEQNLRYYLRCANLDIRATHASFLQLSKIVISINTSIETSPLRRARFRFEPKREKRCKQ